MAAVVPSKKRKRLVLTIEQKLEVLKMLDKSISYTIICEKYGIGRSTVSDIKKSRDKLLKFKKDIKEMGTKRKVKVMKLGDDQLLDKAVYVWFTQKRMEGVPITGPLLCEKAVVLYKSLHKDAKASVFTASEGWKWRFCKRHGIRQLSLQGEKLSADTDAADEFAKSFPQFVKQGGYSLDQIFNCDETGLNFRLLPTKTLAQSFQKSADGRKKSKDRVTLNLCSNASGTIKLPVQLIGKAKKPRCFKGIDMKLLPVYYCNQKNSWMDCGLFHEWFQHHFIPYVRTKLQALRQECKAVLVLDNCSAHPDASELVSDDGKIVAKFLPPNVTALIQPMDQGVIETLKRSYKKKLLRGALIADDRGDSIIDFIKAINMSTIVRDVAEAWDEVTATNLRRSWRKILPIPKPPKSDCTLASVLAWEGMDKEVFELLSKVRYDAPSEDIAETAVVGRCSRAFYFRGIRMKLAHDKKTMPTDETLPEFQSMFAELGFDLSQQEIVEWVDSDASDSGVQVYDDDEICDMVTNKAPEEAVDSEDEEEEEDQNVCPVSNSDAAHYFQQCLTWLERQPEASVYNTTLLRELQSLASNKRVESLKQRRVTSYFQSTS